MPQLLSLCSRALERQLLSPCAATTEAHVLQLLKPMCPRACALQQEKPPQREVLALQLESSSHSPQLEKVCEAMKTQHSQK